MKLLKTLARFLAFCVLIYVVLIGAGRLAQRENGVGILAVIVVVIAIGWIAHVVSRTGSRIPSSGRDPKDVGPIGIFYDKHGGG